MPTDMGRPAWLTSRKYLETVRPLGAGELHARMGAEGDWWWYALETADPAQAETRAREISVVSSREGLAAAKARFPREFTVAFIWHDRPETCTYTTLCTHSPPPRRRARAETTSPLSVGVIEPDVEVRKTMAEWLSIVPGVRCEWMSGSVPRRFPPRTDMIFCRATLVPGLAPVTRVPVIGHAIHASSDDVFSAMTGIAEGYFLRRLPPASMLEPLVAAWESAGRSAARLNHCLARYFQNLFEPRPPTTRAMRTHDLSLREEQILGCLERGLSDREIAAALKISPLTVHTHLKHAYRKLGVHNRTGAALAWVRQSKSAT
jgi:DNA-binding NarL/FixJ family response regulator